MMRQEDPMSAAGANDICLKSTYSFINATYCAIKAGRRFSLLSKRRRIYDDQDSVWPVVV